MDSAIKTIEKYNMLSMNDIVVVAVSGGPDSMALLHLLYSLKSKYCLSIHAAHLNHMLRGLEADEDTRYVVKYCDNYGIPCTVRYVDVKKYAAECGLSEEEAGRKARYSLFSSVASEINATKIALAHNMNDQAETVLMRMIRGTGLDGLCGIKPVRDGLYIRPLIHTMRSEIEKYCEDNNIEPRIDSTNYEPIYTRNRIRLKIIPYIKDNMNSNIEHSISKMAEVLSEDNDYIKGEADKAYTNAASFEEGMVSIDIKHILGCHKAIKRRVIRKAIEDVNGSLEGIESKHIDLVINMIDRNMTGDAVELPGKLKARIRYDKLQILNEPESENICYLSEITIPGRTLIRETGSVVDAEIINIASFKSGDNNSGESIESKLKTSSLFVKYFDYQKFKQDICIRPRRDGDYIVPLGMKGKKKIKDLFIDSKVPREIRNRIPLIASGSEIIWVVGYRISENYKVDKNTKNVLRIEFKNRGDN